MRLLTCSLDGRDHVGVRVDEHVIPVAGIDFGNGILFT